jgi:ADP-heptose:LPS heptosyltransferase
MTLTPFAMEPSQVPFILDQHPQHVLVVQGESRGDVVMLSPALRALRRAMPDAQIILLTSTSGSQVTPLLPWLDGVLVHSMMKQERAGDRLFNPAADAHFIEHLREHNFSLALIFTSFSQSPLAAAQACYMAGIPYRVGFAPRAKGSVLSHALVPPAPDVHQVDRNLFLLEAIGIPAANPEIELEIPERVEKEANDLLNSSGLRPNRPYLVLAPGSMGTISQYDPGRFATVAHLLAAQTEFQLVVVGGAEEAKRLQPVRQLVYENLYGNIYSLLGKATLPVQAAIIRRASLIIANNSVHMHLANAFGCPMVILHSETDLVSQWRPRDTSARLLSRPATCARCDQDDCQYGINCQDVRPEEVAIAALEMLSAQSHSQPAYEDMKTSCATKSKRRAADLTAAPHESGGSTTACRLTPGEVQKS